MELEKGSHWISPSQVETRRLMIGGFSGGTSGKESACQCKRRKRRGFDICVRKMPWKRV